MLNGLLLVRLRGFRILDCAFLHRQTRKVGEERFILDPEGENSGIPGRRSEMVDTAIEVAEEESAPEPAPQAQWELAECTCPDYCERDHELD
jgi:hypothetical protein